MHTSFKSRLKLLRKELGKNQSEVAKLLGVTPGYMSKLENGTKIPSEQFVISICTAFSVSREWLESGEGEMWISNNRGESGRTTPLWYEILRLLSVRSSIFNEFETGIFESGEMKYVQNRIYDAALSQKNLIISGDVGSGKTVILRSFLQKHKKEGSPIRIVFTPCFSEDNRYLLDNFYTSIKSDLYGYTNLTKASDNHELLAKEILNNIYPDPIVLIADNAGDVPKEILRQLISFQQSPDVRNLSIILCGVFSESLESLPNTGSIFLHGLSLTEIPAYIERISKITGNKLPRYVPREIFIGSEGYFDVRNRYLNYAWQQAQISQREDNPIENPKG